MGKVGKILLIISGIIPVLGIFGRPPGTALLIYPLFVAAWLFRKKIEVFFNKISFSFAGKFLLLTIASGLLTEILAWLENYLVRKLNPALFHPQLIPDLILGAGFYIGWALAWLVIFKFWRFSLTSFFIASGIFGVLAEQSGAAFLNLIKTANLSLVVLGVSYLFLVYGAFSSLAYLPLADFNKPRFADNFLKYPAVLILLFLTTQLTTIIVTLLADFLHLIPASRPIWEHPFF